MSGTALENFTTLMASQGPAWMTGPDVLVNDAVKHTYTHARITRGSSIEDMIKGGDMITDTWFPDEKTTFKRYNPNASFNYDNPQTGVTWSVNWAFAEAETSWTKQEVDLNREKFTGEYRAQKYKEVMYQKHQNLWTDVCNSIDSEYWAVPDATRMEATDTGGAPRIPYSIPVFVNEIDASDYSGLTVDGLYDGWTTVQGINPDTHPKWDNYREKYTFDASPATEPLASTAGVGALFVALSKTFHQTMFDRLPKKPEYSDKATSPHFIGTQLEGITNYEFALRVSQDTFRGIGKASGQDPDYNNPTFRGVPLDRISELETALIYPDAAGTGLFQYDDAANNLAAGPRYYCLNGEYLKFVTHEDHYCEMTDPFMPSDQPFTRVQVMDLWNNIVCRSRIRHGIVYPSADVVSA